MEENQGHQVIIRRYCCRLRLPSDNEQIKIWQHPFLELAEGSGEGCGAQTVDPKGPKGSGRCLVVAMLAMVLGIGGYALAQLAEEPVAQEPAPAAQEPVVQEPVAPEPLAPEPVLDEPSCEAIFRDEQAELAEVSVYPTSVSENARACEELGS